MNSNYNENTSHSMVAFQPNKPLFESELNELQQIEGTKIKKLISAMGDCIVPISEDGGVIVSNGTVTVSDCIILAGSMTAYVKSASVSASNGIVYFKL